MAQSITQASQALDKTLQEQLSALYDSDTNGTFQATGQNGATIVYPQGTVSSNVNDGYYYPTFQSFDVTVNNNNGTYSTGPGTFTSQLYGMYGTMVYAVSTSDQQQQNKNANAITSDVNSFYGDTWSTQFGTSTRRYNDNSGTMWGWVTGQQDAQGNTLNSPASLSSDARFNNIQSSLMWVCQQATLDANRTTALQPTYQNYSQADLNAAVTGGTLNYNDIFTGILSPMGDPNPWTQAMYTEYQSLNNQITNNSQNSQSAAQNTAIINTAGTYLANYITGNETQMTNSGNYATVFTNGQQTSQYPNYVPQVTYSKSPAAIASIITDTSNSGDSVSAGVFTSNGGSDTVNIGSSSSSSTSVSGSASDWFWTTSVSATMSSSNQESFSSYDTAAAATTGTFDYGNLSYQSWTIPQSGNNAWLLATQIQSAVENDTPYVYSPNFTGGFGWTNSNDASKYTAEDVSYMKSLAFSGNPTTTITVQSDSSGSEYWSEANYASSSYSASGGFSFGNWFGGVGVSAGTSSSSTYSNAQSSSTWYADSNTAELVSRPLGPIATTINNPNAGYPAMQVGAGIVDIVSANSNYSDSSSSKGRVQTNWHIVDPDKNRTRMDSSDNIVFGSDKSDVIKSSGGDDEGYGHAGNDLIIGGKGDDFLSGGTGKDSYDGGPGKDNFELNSDHFGTGLVTILDFKPKHDTLWFVKVVPELLTTEGKGIYYDGEKIAKIKNLSADEVVSIVENNAVFIG